MKSNVIFYSSAIMAFNAGFVDTSTFTAADGLFSAHVTGNLVIFAYKMVNNPTPRSFISLLSFPVFIVAVMFTVKFNNRIRSQKIVTALIGFILIIAGIAAFILKAQHSTVGVVYKCMLMAIVFAMGMHNTVGRLYSGFLFGPTTVMTGNLTSAIIDEFPCFCNQESSKKMKDLRHSILLLSGFVTGCLFGALISYNYGLVSIVVPGIILIVYYYVFFE